MYKIIYYVCPYNVFYLEKVSKKGPISFENPMNYPQPVVRGRDCAIFQVRKVEFPQSVARDTEELRSQDGKILVLGLVVELPLARKSVKVYVGGRRASDSFSYVTAKSSKVWQELQVQAKLIKGTQDKLVERSCAKQRKEASGLMPIRYHCSVQSRCIYFEDRRRRQWCRN